MPITFVIGRAGSGKTTRTFDRIVELAKAQPLGPPIWLIVPKQATFQAERELVARLGAFARVRIVSIDHLGVEILNEVGGVATEQVTVLGRRMLIGRLLYQNHDQLQFFGSSARKPGLADAISQAFDDFERSGVPLDELPNLGNASTGLTAKLDDLRLLYGQYAALIGDDRLDPHRRRKQVLAQLGRSRLLLGSFVFVDSFFDFTDHERKMILGISQLAAEVEINLTMDPDSPVLSGQPARVVSPFFRTEAAYIRLFETFADAKLFLGRPILLRECHRFRDEILCRVENDLFGQQPKNARPADAAHSTNRSHSAASLELFEAADPRIEARAVARRVRDLLRQGLRQRDIVVLTRNLDTHLHLLHAAFTEHGLKYFADHRRSATHHPLVRFVRAALRIAHDGWLAAPVLELARTRLAGLTTAESDELDNYLREHGITADGWVGEGIWDYAERVSTQDDEIFDVPPPPAETRRKPQAIRTHLVDALQPLAARLHRRAPHATLSDLARELTATLERFQIRKTLSLWIADDRKRAPDRAAEHEQVWTQLVDLLQEMVNILGGQDVTGGEFVEIVESGLDDFELAIAPPTLDQVLIGSVDRTRVLFPRAVFVMGMSQGIFPPTHRDDSLLSGPERRELHRDKIDVEPDAQRRQLDERFLAYIGLTRASERLIVSRAVAAEDGGKMEPSEFWLRLRAIAPDIAVEQELPCTSDDPNCLSTPRDLVTSMLDWARTSIEQAATDRERSTGTIAEEEPANESVDSFAPIPADTGSSQSRTDKVDGWRWDVYQWIAGKSAIPDAVERMIEQAWPSLCYSNSASLSPEHAAGLFPVPLVTSAAELESFSTCPFQHFVSYGLRLRGRRAGDITAIDLSRVYHSAMETLIGELIQTKQPPSATSRQDWLIKVREAAQQAAVDLGRETLLAEARSQYLLNRVGRTLEMVLDTLLEQWSLGSYLPKRVGVPFGPDQKLKSPELPLSAGGVLQLRGSIDRVDEAPGSLLAAVDYRLGEQKIVAEEVYYGLNLRLLTCLLVLEQSPVTKQTKKLLPVAALSARLLRSLQKVEHPAQANPPESREYRLAVKARGVVKESFAQTFDRNLGAGQTSEVLAVVYKKDGMLARADQSDAFFDDTFADLMRFVEKKIRDLGDQIVAGDIRVRPYWREEATPCPNCEYRSICRFEKEINRYQVLKPLNRPMAMEAMKGNDE